MRKYIVHVCYALLAIPYSLLLGYIISGQPFTKTNLSDSFYSLIGTFIGVSIGLALAFPDIKKRFERNEEDERYIQKRGQFSFYFIVALFVAIPFVLLLFNLNGSFVIHTKDIAKCVLILIFIYSIGLYVLKKR